jgi:hypothetical protein
MLASALSVSFFLVPVLDPDIKDLLRAALFSSVIVLKLNASHPHAPWL